MRESSKESLPLASGCHWGCLYGTATVFDTFGIISRVTEGRVPLAYLLALVAMLLTALSYAHFRRISSK